MAKVYAICTVYFPQFEEKVRQVERTALDFEVWIGGAAQRRLADVTTALNGHVDVIKPYSRYQNECWYRMARSKRRCATSLQDVSK